MEWAFQHHVYYMTCDNVIITLMLLVAGKCEANLKYLIDYQEAHPVIILI